jgi:S-layer protein
VPAGESSATFDITPTDDNSTEGFEGFKIVLLDDSFAEIASSENVVISDPENAGQSFTLTTGVDSGSEYQGGAGNDTYTAYDEDTNSPLDGEGDVPHLGNLDDIDGGDGNDTLKIFSTDTAAFDHTGDYDFTVSNIENINLTSTSAAGAGYQIDTSDWAGVENVNSLKSNILALTAGDDQAVTVSGVTKEDADTTVEGGSSVDFTGSGDVTIGDATVPAGAVTVDHTSKNTGDAIAIDGGTDVTVTDAADKDTNGTSATVTIGDNTLATATDQPTGAIEVTQNLSTDGTNAITGGAVDVAGGTSVDITVSNTIVDEDADADNNGISHNGITVTADENTESVTVTQTADITEDVDVNEGGSSETTSVTFKALKEGDAVTINGLTFTAAQDLTAEQVAQAFANLTATDTQNSQGVVENGIYTGTHDGDWTSAAADGDSVLFTSEAGIGNNGNTLTYSVTDNGGGSASLDAPVVTAGTNYTDTAAESNNTVTYGAATITDSDDVNASITTITLDGYAATSEIEGANNLATLSLANSTGAINVDAAVDTLQLNLDDVDDAVDLDDSGDANNDSIKTLTITTTGSESDATLTADAVTDLTVNGTAMLDMDGASSFAALKNVTVTESAGLDLQGTDPTVLESIDASGTSGNVAATIDPKIAADASTEYAYQGGTGSDTVSLDTATNTTTIDSKIDLGDGDDKLTLEVGTTAATKTVVGGDGTDTLSMTFATANNLDTNTVFDNQATGFEKLEISDNVNGNTTTDLDYLTYDYVIAHGTTAATHTLDNLASDGTLELNTAAGTYAVNVKDAAEDGHDSDELNLVLNNADSSTGLTDLDLGQVTAADVETININASDTNVDEDGDGETYEPDDRDTVSLDLRAVDATSIVIDGNANLDLANALNTKVTEIDGSTMTGALDVTAAGGTATTIKGGEAGDTLTASTGGIVGEDNATNKTLTVEEDGAGGSTDGVDFVAEVDDITILADGSNDNDENVTVTYDSDGSTGGGGATVAIDLSGIDVTDASATAAEIVSQLNSDGGFSAVATASNSGADLTVTYDQVTQTTFGPNDVITSIAQGIGTFTNGTSIINGGNFTDTEDGVAAVSETAVLTIADNTSNAGLTEGDTLSVTVDYDGAGAGAAETITHTVTTATQSIDDALTDFTALLDAKTGIGAVKDSATQITITDATADAAGIDVSALTITDFGAGDAAADTLYGYAGDDTLNGGTGTELYGGDGVDTFVADSVVETVNSYSKIMDVESGDIIKVQDSAGNDMASFAKLSDANTPDPIGDPNLLSYASAATGQNTDDNGAVWFNYNDNTFIVLEDTGATGDDYVGGEDNIIMLSGVVDLSTDASFNATSGTLEIA